MAFMLCHCLYQSNINIPTSNALFKYLIQIPYRTLRLSVCAICGCILKYRVGTTLLNAPFAEVYGISKESKMILYNIKMVHDKSMKKEYLMSLRPSFDSSKNCILSQRSCVLAGGFISHLRTMYDK